MPNCKSLTDFLHGLSAPAAEPRISPAWLKLSRPKLLLQLPCSLVCLHLLLLLQPILQKTLNFCWIMLDL